jgi:hypothetical protein
MELVWQVIVDDDNIDKDTKQEDDQDRLDITCQCIEVISL